MKRKFDALEDAENTALPYEINNAGQISDNTNELYNLALANNSLYQLPMELLTSEYDSGITSVISSLQDRDLLQTKVNLAKSCRKFNFFLKASLNEDAVNQFLLPFVLKLNHADVNKALTLIQSNSDLLFITGLTKDYSGRVIKQSPFQAALSTGNIGLLKEMEKMFVSKEQKLIALQDLHDRLDTTDERKMQMLIAFKEVLAEVIEAIDNDHCVDGKPTQPQTLHALEKMQEILNLHAFVARGEHFPLEILAEVLRVYNQKLNSKLIASSWQSSNNRQQCFSCDVLGYVLRFCTADDMLRFRKVKFLGDYPTDENELLSLSCDFIWPIGGVDTMVFPLDLNKDFRLGFEFFLNIYNRQGDTRNRKLPLTTPSVLVLALEKLIENKRQFMERMRERLMLSLSNSQTIN